VLVTTWGHDPTIVYVSNLLLTVNDALTHSAVFIQVRGTGRQPGLESAIENRVAEFQGFYIIIF